MIQDLLLVMTQDAKISVSGNDVLITNATTDGDIQIRVNDGDYNCSNLDGATRSTADPCGTWRGN